MKKHLNTLPQIYLNKELIVTTRMMTPSPPPPPSCPCLFVDLEINFDLLFDNHTFSEDALFPLRITAWSQSLETDMHQYASPLPLQLPRKNLSAWDLISQSCVLFAITEYMAYMEDFWNLSFIVYGLHFSNVLMGGSEIQFLTTTKSLLLVMLRLLFFLSLVL